MFESAEFKNMLQDAVGAEVLRNNMESYHVDIIDFLVSHAKSNESHLMEIEERKNIKERRGVPEALGSARDLIRTASAIAADAERSTITLQDVESAYRDRYCRVWPFCR